MMVDKQASVRIYEARLCVYHLARLNLASSVSLCFVSGLFVACFHRW